MRKKLIAAIMGLGILAVGSVETPAFAGFVGGNELYQNCTASERSATYYQDSARCLAYILGVHDDVMLTRAITGTLTECTPDTITAGQLRDVVLKYMRENPAKRDLPASALVRLAIIDAWPQCGAGT